ncbi:unnamed protein product [Prorocentrum cordatum]|uniref:Helicase ATP-binding domain-containing protein n=1 Tax=Prorocentrum cordatum TaxID=2364126 RepID=A0ABN9VYP7_9DINO|nr:unnamed protein product [Polarella glacialis]
MARGPGAGACRFQQLADSDSGDSEHDSGPPSPGAPGRGASGPEEDQQSSVASSGSSCDGTDRAADLREMDADLAEAPAGAAGWSGAPCAQVGLLPGGAEASLDFYRPVACFEDLVERGVPSSLVDACRSLVGKHSRPTPIQAACWGLLLDLPPAPRPELAPGACAEAAAAAGAPAAVAQQRLAAPSPARPEDIPVPASDSDDELLGGQEDGLAVAAASEAPCAEACVVREQLDLVGVAPTGSGKTLAYMLPLLADGLCSAPVVVAEPDGVFERFRALFPQSFPLGQGKNSELLRRCEKLRRSDDQAAWTAAVVGVAEKGAACRDEERSAAWRELQADVRQIGLLCPRALVLAPTRELAQQVAEVAAALGSASAAVIGGVDHVQQRERIRAAAPALLVATPGRLRALCGQLPSSSRARAAPGEAREAPASALRLGRIVRLVLDEGDRLLDEGFGEDIQALTRLAARRRLALLFSATWSPRVEPLRATLRPAAVQVEVLPKAAKGRRLREVLRGFGEQAKENPRRLSVSG